MQSDCEKEVPAESLVPKVPQVPQDPEIININSQCADIENWDEKAFPLMIERADGGEGGPFTTLSIHSADLLVALMTKRLRLATPNGVMECPPCIEDHPDMIPFVQWLKGASASVKSRRSLRSK